MARLHLVTVLCASVVVLSACGKDDAPKQAPSSATAPTAPSASTPAAPSAPAPTAPAQPADTNAGGATAAVDDAAARDLLAKNGCTACHAVDKKIVGPAYQEIAAKYRGQTGVEDKLVVKVKNGGSGVWGPVPMPPNPQVKDNDVRTMVRWILSVK